MSAELQVEENLSADVVARVKAMQADDKSLVVTPFQKGGKSVQAPDVEPTESKADDDPKDTADTTDDSGSNGAVADSPSGDQAPVLQLMKDLDESLKMKKVDREAFMDKLLEEHKLTVKVKGKDRKITFHDIKSMVGREDTFQKKYDSLTNSEEFKLLTVLKAAKGGDKSAIKKLHGILVESSKAGDGDRLLMDLEETKDDFDVEKAHKAQQDKESWDTVFADVKEDVDYNDILNTIQTDLKKEMPPKVYKAYWDAPLQRKSMYDLIKSGRSKELLAAFSEQLAELPLSKQMEIEDSPELWGSAFVKVIRQANKTAGPRSTGKKSAGETSRDTDDDGLKSVSSGSKGRRSSPNAPAGPDWLNMPKEEFEKAQRKMGTY